jgi:rubrerythrin
MSNEIQPIDNAAPSWVVTMRQVAMNALKESDIEAIVANQVEAAKKGDRNAIRFVFEQVLGGQAVKAATYVQNNYHGDSAQRRQSEDAAIWECAGCRERVIDTRPPQMCRKCEKTKFNRVMRKAV